MKEYQGHAVGEIEVGIAASSRQQSVVRETAALESGVLKTEQPALLPRLVRYSDRASRHTSHVTSRGLERFGHRGIEAWKTRSS